MSSVITKYLSQNCTLAKAHRTSDNSLEFDKYGTPEYSAPITLRCRKEQGTKSILTSNGAMLKSSTEYYLSGDIKILIDDKLDGQPVVAVEEMVNSVGVTIGYHCYV